MPKRRRSDSFQHRLERESRQRAAEAELAGNIRDGAPNDLRGDDRRNFLSPVIRLVRGAARVVRRTIRVADLAADGGASAPPTIASITNRLVVLGGWLVRGDDAFVGCSDRTRESYRPLVCLVRAEWDAEREASTTRVRWSHGTKRATEVGRLVAALTGEFLSKHEESYSYPYSYTLHLQAVSRRHAAAATLTANLRGGAPEHLTGDGRRNYLCPPVRLQRETAMLVRRMIVVAAGARYGYRGDPYTLASMATLLTFAGGWLVFRDDALDELPPGARESYKPQFEALRTARLLDADLPSQSSTAAGEGATSAPAGGSTPTAPQVAPGPGMRALSLWAVALGIQIEWTDDALSYHRRKRRLRLSRYRMDVDQFVAILCGMVFPGPSMAAVSADRRRDVLVLAAQIFAARLKLSERFAVRMNSLACGGADDDIALRSIAQEAADWLWGVCQSLPSAALEDLNR